MNPLTAACFVLTATTLVRSPRHATGLRRTLILGTALAIGACGCVRLVAYAFQLELPLDQILFSTRLGLAGNSPNHMAPNTAFNFAALGFALVSLVTGHVRRAQGAVILVMLTSGIALLGYAYSVTSLAQVKSFTPMALHTSGLFAMVCIAVSCAMPEVGVVGMLSRAGLGGHVLRIMLPTFILGAPLLGWLRLQGEIAGLFSASFGVAILIGVMVVLGVAASWKIAHTFDVAESVRRRADQDARDAADARAVLEKRLTVADRMVSVGTLASGIAHEINNPLTYVLANLEIIIDEIGQLGTDSASISVRELEQLARDAYEGAERIRKIVGGMKTFSRADEERHEVIEVVPALELAIDMSFNEIRHRAKIVKDYGDTPLIEADDARLGQVFINLLVNAAQALPLGDADNNEIYISTFTDPEGRAVVEIRDTGPGIPEDIRTRIFEPFFTTKSVGEGTGLGLSICHNIVTGMGGEIKVTSNAGVGAAFRIAIPPAKTQQVTGDPTTIVAVPPAPTRSASILVVDDEPAIGVTLQRILRGHDVTLTSTVAEAVEQVASGKHFDLIFSDMMMPQATGEDFYCELTRRAPDAAARMVFMTGGAFTAAAAAFLEDVGNERLAKPFSAPVVRELVKRLLPATLGPIA